MKTCSCAGDPRTCERHPYVFEGPGGTPRPRTDFSPSSRLVATLAEHFPMHLITCRFADDNSGKVFVGYTDGRLWNGFACPQLPIAELTRVLETLVEWGDEQSFDAAADGRSVRVVGTSGDSYVMKAHLRATADGDRWLFDCGGAWTFVESKEDS